MASGGKLQAPRGTFDVLPDEGRRRAALRRICEELFEPAGYGPIETPVFEATELFARGVGETTDIVQKEMFTFEDQGGRSLTLRPEGTAGVCRAYLEHGMHKLPQPVKLWYWGPFFRHEAPQAGRYRQFNQVGIEAIGSDDPSLDAESILLLGELLERVGAKGLRLRLGSLGTPDTRRAYSDELRDYLRGRESELSGEVRDRLEANPLRAFDSDHPGTQAVMRDAPKLLERLNPDDAAHFAEVRALLDEAGRSYDVDDALVRGIDYYTRTVFEFTSDALGAQSGVGGGGRYDGLVEQLGGAHTPGVGFASGIERILMVSAGPETADKAPDVYVVRDGDGAATDAFAVLRALRDAGFSAQMEQAGRSLKGQLKQADRVGARAVVIVGGVGVPVKDMSSGDQQDAPDLPGAIEML
ncbi:MAG TPA: histidine--tRNA ligase, partial [Thermoleophilaceae bacterium]